MKQIQLTQGKIALVDDDTYLAIGHLKWSAQKRKNNLFYAVRHFRKLDGTRDLMYLHHIVIGFPLNKMKIDHKDGNGLNNQRLNLQIVTTRINGQNQIRHRNGKLVGTTFGKKDKKWRAQVLVGEKKVYLGAFNTEQEAADTYTDFVIDHNLK